jgi:hypothetical protein
VNVPITGDLVFLILGVLAAVGGLWWRIEARFASADHARSALQRELAEYKLFVAQNHVSAAVLKDTELRLINAIEKLASRMEAIAEKFDERSRGG